MDLRPIFYDVRVDDRTANITSNYRGSPSTSHDDGVNAVYLFQAFHSKVTVVIAEDTCLEVAARKKVSDCTKSFKIDGVKGMDKVVDERGVT